MKFTLYLTKTKENITLENVETTADQGDRILFFYKDKVVNFLREDVIYIIEHLELEEEDETNS